MIRSRIRGFLSSFHTLFGYHEKSYDNHGAAPDHLFNRESMPLFGIDFLHHLGITKIHMKSMGQHLVINSRSAALHDTLTLEEDPGVSEYLSEYLFIMSERLIDATSILPCELEAPPV
jgi:hypothetical protein